MFKFKKYTIRTAFREIQSNNGPMAALVFAHGIELLPVRALTLEQKKQFDMLLNDFSNNLVGIYDASAHFQNFADDVQAVKTELFLNDIG